MRFFFKFTPKPTTRHFGSSPDRDVAKSICFSKCTDIFTNLALEDWFYKNIDFANKHVLMLWRNEPCVVIGRHQNPWLECNFAMLPNMGVKLARRNSGGGTVYHDMQNLNLTFFTSREEYSRRRNLELISRALRNSLSINSEINRREDLCIEDCKISGTASKLGRTTAYHHCTLLVNANKEHLSTSLKNIIGPRVKTTASVSVRSKIMNLNEVYPGINVEEVMEAIIKEYSSNNEVKVIESINEYDYPGVNESKEMFLSDQWRFEKTPKFTIFRDLFGDGAEAFLTVEKAKVFNAGIQNKNIELSLINNNLGELSEVFRNLMEKLFSKNVLDEFDMLVCGLKNSKKCRTMVENR